jgi:hypothetical protein
MEPNLVTQLVMCQDGIGIKKLLKGMCIFAKFYYGYNGSMFPYVYL